MKIYSRVLAAAVGLTLSSSAFAAYTVNIREVGSNVVATGSGSINTDSLSYWASGGFGSAQMDSSTARLFIGPASETDLVIGFTGPTNFGTGPFKGANSVTGVRVGIFTDYFELPSGYVSGTALQTSTATWNATSFADLGLTTGTYTWSWGNEASADTFTIRVGAVVPEPATWAMMLIGFGSVGFAMRRRSAVGTTVSQA